MREQGILQVLEVEGTFAAGTQSPLVNCRATYWDRGRVQGSRAQGQGDIKR